MSGNAAAKYPTAATTSDIVPIVLPISRDSIRSMSRMYGRGNRTKEDIDEILRRCDYSESFVKTANDLQILDAVSSCYEEYKVLHRD